MTDDQKTSMEKVLGYVLGRLKEPSTWAGVAVFIGMFGLSPDTIDRLTSNGPAIITAVATVIAIFAPSGSRKALTAALDAKTTANAVADATGVSVNPPAPPSA